MDTNHEYWERSNVQPVTAALQPVESGHSIHPVMLCSHTRLWR